MFAQGIRFPDRAARTRPGSARSSPRRTPRRSSSSRSIPSGKLGPSWELSEGKHASGDLRSRLTDESSPAATPDRRPILRDLHARSDEGGPRAAVHAGHARGVPVLLAQHRLRRAEEAALASADAGHARLLFLAFTLKLTPARRLIYGISLLASLIGLMELFREVHFLLIPHPAFAPGTLWLLTGFLLVNLLVLLEVADRLSLKNDLEIAREIQQSMLPRAAFKAPGVEAFGMTRPANTVGGDFYDILPLARRARAAGARRRRRQGQPRGAADGAAAGDDAHARGRRARGRRPRDAAERADRQTRAALSIRDAVRRDPRSRDRRVVVRQRRTEPSAAATRTTDRYERLRAGGMALGMFENATYTTGATMLEPGDVLVMYSDGITEAEDTFDQPFDEAGVQTVVDGPGLGDRRRSSGGRCSQAVETHSRERRLLDDLTVLALAGCLPAAPDGRRLGPVRRWQSLSNWRLMCRFSAMRWLLVLACVCLWASPSSAQTPEPDPVAPLLRRFEQALNRGDRPALTGTVLALTSRPPRSICISEACSCSGAVKTTVRERDRAPLEGAPPGDGYSLVVEFFIETPGRARILTAGMDMRRPPDGDLASWRFVGAEGLTSVEGLYKLRIDKRPLTARNLEVTSEDLVLQFAEGTVFRVECDDGVTGLVLLGRGEMTFLADVGRRTRAAPALLGQRHADARPSRRRSSVSSPSDYDQRVAAASLTEAAPDARQARRAEEVFARTSDEVVQRRSAGSQPRRLAPASADRRLSRRGRHASLRHAHVHADRRRRPRTSACFGARIGARSRSIRRWASSPRAAASTATMRCATTTCWTTASTRRSIPERSTLRGRARLVDSRPVDVALDV